MGLGDEWVVRSTGAARTNRGGVWNESEGCKYSSLVRVRYSNISKVADPVVPRFHTYPERVVFSETMRPARQHLALVPPSPLLSDQLPVLPCTPRACEWRDEYAGRKWRLIICMGRAVRRWKVWWPRWCGEWGICVGDGQLIIGRCAWVLRTAKM